MHDADRGRVRIGAVATASEFVLPPLMASFAEEHPQVELSLSVLPRDELFSLAADHAIDVVLAGRPPRGSGLVTRAQRANRLVLVGRPGLRGDPLTTTWLLTAARLGHPGHHARAAQPIAGSAAAAHAGHRRCGDRGRAAGDSGSLRCTRRRCASTSAAATSRPTPWPGRRSTARGTCARRPSRRLRRASSCSTSATPTGWGRRHFTLGLARRGEFAAVVGVGSCWA